MYSGTEIIVYGHDCQTHMQWGSLPGLFANELCTLMLTLLMSHGFTRIARPSIVERPELLSPLGMTGRMRNKGMGILSCIGILLGWVVCCISPSSSLVTVKDSHVKGFSISRDPGQPTHPRSFRSLYFFRFSIRVIASG